MTEANLTPQHDTILRSAACPLEFRAASSGVIEGLASPYGPPADAHGTIFAPGAYAESLTAFRASGRLPAMLWDHDPGAPVGRWDEMVERRDGLHVKGTVNLRTERGRDAFEHLRAGDATGLSVGFRPQEMQGNAYTRVQLLEVSLVTVPSADRARVTQVRSLGSRAELRDILLGAGLARAAAEKLSRGGWPALTGEEIDETDADELAREMRAIAAILKG
jgi:HK97 family phage prohead protease